MTDIAEYYLLPELFYFEEQYIKGSVNPRSVK